MYADLLPTPQTPTSQLSPSQAAALLLQRRKIRSSLLAWCEYALAPANQSPARHHQLIIGELEKVARGECDRLMLLLPPGSAKSTYASVLFPAWFMARGSGLQIIGSSHTASLAEDFSRRVQAQVREHSAALTYGLATESAELWTTTHGCRYRAAGIGGPITGFRADLAILDDPVKSRAVAESEVEREKAWHWFSADLRTRLKPGARIVLIMTRWHEDDLGGRLLQQQGHLWRVVKLPAIAGENDPLGRAPGEWLWDDTPEYPYASELKAVLAECEANGAMRDWSALYQQDPRPGDGALFKTALIGTLDAAPAGGKFVRAWDLAATEQVGTRNPDWTVGLLMQRTDEGRFVVRDLVRVRGGPDEVEATIRATAERDTRTVPISLPQDPGQAGKQQVLYLTRRLAGWRVESSPETGDKATRAAPYASQVNVGNVSVIRAGWNAPYLDELAGFPSAAKDDQVDASSRAFNALIAPPEPARTIRLQHMGR